MGVAHYYSTVNPMRNTILRSRIKYLQGKCEAFPKSKYYLQKKMRSIFI